MSGFIAMVKKELRSVTREKTIMIAIIIQLFIASFSSAILIGLMSFYDPESIGISTRINISVGIVGDVRSPLVRFLQYRNVRVSAWSSPQEAEDAFEAGTIDAALYIPQAGREDYCRVVEMELFLPKSESLSTMIMMVLKEPFERYENYLRERCGVYVRYLDVEGMPSTTYEFRYAFIIPVLMFFPAFVAGSMVIDSISEEMENHTLETLWSAPLSLNGIFGAKIFAALTLAVVQFTLWSLLLRLNGIRIQNLGLVWLLAAVLAAVVAIGSALISTCFKDRERSQFLYSLLVALAASVSYFSGFSPITLMTQLATGDYYASATDVAAYVVLLLALLAVFPYVTKRLIAARG